MCLNLLEKDPVMSRKFRICYKVVRKDWGWPNRRLRSQYRREFTWKVGCIKSDRLSVEVQPHERRDRTVHQGIHVYWNKQFAETRVKVWGSWNGSPLTVLPVRCYRKNLVVRGKHDAVFTRVTVTRKAYQKALR